LPVVGVKALAKGLAFVVSDIGGFVDLVRDGENGYLVNLHNLQEFGEILQTLLSSPQKLLSFRLASLQFAQLFDIKNIVERYEGLLVDPIMRN
jgi:glycosyltransferase involved in cell wall biosynthesis